MTRRTSRIAVVAPLAAFALLLGACSSDDAPAETPTAADEKKPPADDDTDASATGGDACLIGEWVADTEQQIAASTEMLVGAGLEVKNISVTGEAITAFTETEVTSQYEDQATDITMSMEGQEIRTVTNNNGSSTGSYSVEGDQLTMSGFDTSAVESEVETYINGALQPTDDSMAAAQVEQMAKNMEVTTTYTCDGDTLTLTTPDFGTGLSVEAVLHRR